MSHSRYFWYHLRTVREYIRKRNGETSLKSWKHILLNKNIKELMLVFLALGAFFLHLGIMKTWEDAGG